MNKARKLILKSSLLVLLMLPLLAMGHYLAFPQETRCILIDYSDFHKDGNLYFKSNVPVVTVDSIKNIINEAYSRDRNFLGKLTCRPKFIFCDNDIDYAVYGNPFAPACTYTKLGAYIVLSRDGINVDVVAHEMMHAELYELTGFFNYQFKMPVWYKEGLAMQVDYRSDFSEDSLRAYSNNFRSMPDLRKCPFSAGTNSQVVLNYATARFEVNHWYTKGKMKLFVAAINNGSSFDKAYK